jgi:hypothetical protein
MDTSEDYEWELNDKDIKYLSERIKNKGGITNDSKG